MQAICVLVWLVGTVQTAAVGGRGLLEVDAGERCRAIGAVGTIGENGGVRTATLDVVRATTCLLPDQRMGMSLSKSVRALCTKVPPLGMVVAFAYRTRMVLGQMIQTKWQLLKWLWTSREYTNFTYDLTERNRHQLASFVAAVCCVPLSQAEGYLRELDDDRELREHLSSAMQRSPERIYADKQVHYGRRMGWYAVVRALKPKVVIETGLDKGMGSCVITAALRRNAAEGARGTYYGTDINPYAGYLLQSPYAEFGKVLYGDSIESLTKLEASIDCFINDSDHSAEYEGREYRTIVGKLSPNAVVLGDNSHVTDELWQFAKETGRTFLFFREQPKDHWYAGAGIGAAFGGAANH